MSLVSFRRLVRDNARLYLLAIPILFACDSPSAPEQILGRIWVTTSLTGLDFPAKFGVRIEGSGTVVLRDLNLGDSIFVGFSKKGTYTIKLNGLASNCSTSENPQTLNLTETATFRVQFDVTCGALYGVLRVSMTTTGEDLDPTYKIVLNQGVQYSVGANGTFQLNQILGGTQEAELVEVASNCHPTGAVRQSFSLAVGGPTRDTARVSFSVACTRAERFAFSRQVTTISGPSELVMVANADGLDPVWTFSGFAPAWSRQGTFLALGWISCDSYYYYYYGPCSKVGLASVNYQTGDILRLTNDSTDTGPSWRPDGDAIVFERRGQLFIVDATKEGNNPVPVPTPAAVTRAFQPAWSPDGFKIAFACEIDSGAPDICVIAPDGSGFVRLTTDASLDSDPEWSPDGAQIAFTTIVGDAIKLAVMPSAGGAITRLTDGRNPAWSTDGTRILFEGSGATKGIFMFALSSSAVTRLTLFDDHDPTWRP
ncbi:MAG TPA: hypothetical protein VIF83_10090 [Gemmatimonadaceae bacterium]|jgi:hypothetical protein